MLTIGGDPDLHDLALAAWDDGGPVAAHVVVAHGQTGNEAVMAMFLALTRQWEFAVPGKPDAYAVEAQESRPVRGKHHARPIDLIRLGNVAGMVVMRLAATYPGSACYFPEPAQWKGSVPKAVMQARLYTELGWDYEIRGKGAGAYAVPHGCQARVGDGFQQIGTAQWKHCGDALLLARWCWEQQAGRKWRRVD